LHEIPPLNKSYAAARKIIKGRVVGC